MRKIIYFLYFVLVIFLSYLIFNHQNYYAETMYIPLKVVAFTFDDGPSKYTKKIADLLYSFGFKATFFELGSKMKENEETINYILSLGMEVGNHGYSHIDSNYSEINSTSILFNEITGKNIKLYRPIYGNVSSELITYPIILWSLDTLDWKLKNSNLIANNILDNIREGDIVLLHDIYEESFDALKIVLPILKERGYFITSVSEGMDYNDVIISPNKVYYDLKRHL